MEKKSGLNILVLVGGDSAEREVSLSSGAEVARALEMLGHEVKTLDTGRGVETLGVFTGEQLPGNALASFRQADCVFNALHGGVGENGTLQAMLDLAGVRYTGSGMFASAVAMDKYRSRIIFEAVGVPVPPLRFFGTIADARKFLDSREASELHFPVVVKPNTQGSTIGLSIVARQEDLERAFNLAAEHDSYVLVEDYIAGRELTVAILGKEALPVVEIIPKSGFYDYRAKYTSGESSYVCPAEIDDSVRTAAMDYAMNAFTTLGCDGYARVDFRLNEKNELFCLELNTLPGMTTTSLVPKAAKAVGMSFEQLLQRIVDLALKKD